RLPRPRRRRAATQYARPGPGRHRAEADRGGARAAARGAAPERQAGRHGPAPGRRGARVEQPALRRHGASGPPEPGAGRRAPGRWSPAPPVLVNLITNAHHALRGAPAPRRLTLTASADPGQSRVAIEVADTGPGIPPEVLSRLFEPFFTTKPPGQGTGLGLSLCRGIVEEHAGSITVESGVGQGARFRIELPVTAPEAEREEPAVARRAAVRGKSILVVDDEADVAEVLAEILALDDHQVDVTLNGQVALDRILEKPYDLVF